METQDTVIQGYIPERFKTTFCGFPRKYPYEKIEAAKKKEKRNQMLRYRERYNHKSRGWNSFRKQIKKEILDSIEFDYRWNGEDEYPVREFQPETATRKVFELIRKKGLLKYIK